MAALSALSASSALPPRGAAPAAASPLAIDLGESQMAALLATVAQRLARRSANPDAGNGFLARAASLLGKQSGTLPALVDRRTPLSKLARMGVLPADFTQSPELSYKRLRNAYDLSALTEFGVTWAHVLTLGFDVDDLQQVTVDEFRALKVTADDLVRDLPLTGQDLAALKLQPHVLRELKFNFDHFEQVGMQSAQLSRMMSPQDLQTYFAPSAEQLRRLPVAATPAAAPAAPRRAPQGLSF